MRPNEAEVYCARCGAGPITLSAVSLVFLRGLGHDPATGLGYLCPRAGCHWFLSALEARRMRERGE